MPTTAPLKPAKKKPTMSKPTAQAIIANAATAQSEAPQRARGYSIYPPPALLERIHKARLSGRGGMLPITVNQWVIEAILDKLDRMGQ